jgi:uncharacterized protein
VSYVTQRSVRSNLNIARAGLTLAFAAFWGPALLTPARAADVPSLTGRVVDTAGVLSPATRDRLTQALATHEQRTTDQIAVLTVPTIGDMSIEEYSTKVFETWKLGMKGKDNGVLIVIVPKDRKMRIEVGYGLEGTLTDLAASRIIRNSMSPRFKAGDFDGGVTDGVMAVIAQLECQPNALPDAASTHGLNVPFKGTAQSMPWPMRIFLGAFVFGILGLFTFMGVVTPGFGGWFIYPFLIPFWAIFPVLFLGTKVHIAVLALYLLGFPIAKLLARQTAWYSKAAQDIKLKGTASIGGFAIGGGGGSGGGGGFSGGGGSSGGGGASGSW